MICGICRKREERLEPTEFGAVCAKCLPGIKDRETKLYQELLQEDAVSMPAFVDVEAFERLSLKFALHYLVLCGQEHIEHLRRSRPALLKPRIMALYIRDKVLDHIPLYYVSSMKSEGSDENLYSGTYVFKKSIPERVVFDAFTKAGLVKIGEEGA